MIDEAEESQGGSATAYNAATSAGRGIAPFVTVYSIEPGAAAASTGTGTGGTGTGGTSTGANVNGNDTARNVSPSPTEATDLLASTVEALTDGCVLAWRGVYDGLRVARPRSCNHRSGAA